ncbi:MAG: hypothetical protein ACKVTZ_17885 [Bacteroidia bacterium]
MTKNILLFLFLLVSFSAFSQVKNQTAFWLKNGSYFLGEIVETTEDALKVKLTDESYVWLNKGDIVGQKRYKGDDIIIKGMKGGRVIRYYPTYQAKKDAVTFEGSLLALVSARFALYYNWKKYAQLGGGVGIFLWQTDYSFVSDGFTFPIYASVMGTWKKTSPRNEPYYFGQAGYGIGVRDGLVNDKEELKGGFYQQTGIGLRRYTKHHFYWLYNLSFLSQNTIRTYTKSVRVFNPITQANEWSLVNVTNRSTFYRGLLSIGVGF